MCGIAGIVHFNEKISENIIKEMIKPMTHRGPDDEGFVVRQWQNATVAFGQKRLSIIDLSQGGHQPMTFRNLDIVLNGEIYNYLEIKKDLQKAGYDFVSTSDTEVVLKSFDYWGLDCVHRFLGMFAFCIMDNQKHTLYLCRDRLGVKPLYYYYHEDVFLFASELKAFQCIDQFKGELDHPSVRNFLQFGYIPGPKTIFKHTSKLLQGHWAELDCNHRKLNLKSYWKIIDYFNTPRHVSYEEAKQETERLMIDACKYRMIADVPVGLFLSGGYDSTLVAALLTQQGFRDLRTYTIGFPDGMDESKDAEKIANHLGTNHTSFNCTLDEAKKLIPDLPYYFDEPIGDISCIPTIMVSRLAAKEVKVAISADGGDELFAGYNGYYQSLKRMSIIQRFPKYLKPVVQSWSNIASKNSLLTYQIRHKLKGWADFYNSDENIYDFVLNSSKIPDSIIDNITKLESTIENKSAIPNLIDRGNNILLSHYMSNLPDYLLVKIDRASMAASLEAREPLLDHRLVEYAAGLPFEYKNDGNTSKRIIRDIVHQYVPSGMMERPKAGFDLPIFDWLKGDLRNWMETYFSEEKIHKTQVLDFNEIQKIKQHFLNDTLVYKNIVWHLLVFLVWYERWFTEKKQIKK